MFEKFEKLENANLKNFSTMRTGGRARVVLFPRDVEELKEIIELCAKSEIRMYVIGNGSNILFSDEGFDGALVSLKHFDKVEVVRDGTVCVGAGVNLFTLNQKLARLGLSGLEFSYGIPATLGGFLVMNGGCFEHEISQFVQEVTVLDRGEVRCMEKRELQFSYRKSNLKGKVVLEAILQLTPDSEEEIRERLQHFLKRKRESQPCELPSLGSVFKRVEGDEIIYPAKLIDNLGLKGVKIGGAEVSTKHAGFVVNTGSATSADVLALVELIEQKLLGFGVKPEREIIVVK